MRQTTIILPIDGKFQLLQVVERDMDGGVHQKVIKKLGEYLHYTDALLNKFAAEYLIRMAESEDHDASGKLISYYEAEFVDLVTRVASKFGSNKESWKSDAHVLFNKAIDSIQMQVDL